MDLYMKRMESRLQDGRARLARRSITMRAEAPAFSLLARRRLLMRFEAKFTDVTRRFELLRNNDGEGISELKIALEKAIDGFDVALGWKI